MRIGDSEFQDLVAQRLKEWQVRQHLTEAEPAPAAAVAPMRVVTVSREMGSGGSEIAQVIACELGWDLWDRQIVDEIARSAHVRTEVVESLDEHTRSEVLSILRELLGDRLQEAGYRYHLAQVVLTIARHGNAVIVGRGANYLLPQAFNLRVVAPMAARAARVAHREGISRDDAEHRCHASDRERADFVRTLYGRDINNALDYDVVANTGHLQSADAAAMLAVGLRLRFGL